MDILRKLMTTFLVVVLTNEITPTSSVFAEDGNPQIYLVKGEVSSSSQDRLEYERAVAKLRTQYPGVDYHIYDYEGNNVETNSTLSQDVEAHPNAEKYGFFYSHGVKQLGDLDSQDVRFQFAVTLDGCTAPFSPIELKLQNTDFNLNILTPAPGDFPWLYGGTHTVAQGEYIQVTVGGIKHEDLLKVAINSGLLEMISRRAVGSAGSGSVGSGGGGGVESRPLWLGQTRILDTQKGLQNSYQTLQSSSGLLLQFIPSQGPRGELRQLVIPKDVIGSSNAIEAIGMDYLYGATSQVVASIFGAETLNSVYEHDYVVCSRVQNFEVQTVFPFRYNLHWWWMIRAEKSSDGYDELVIPLTIMLNGSQAIVDSRYLVDNYPSSVSGTVLNYQIRAADLLDAMFFLDSVLTTLAGSYTVSFANVSEPPPPTVFARRATYRNPNIKLVVENRGQAQSVRFFGPTWTEPHATAEQFVEFNITVPNGTSEVSLPVGAIHDAVIYIEAEDFLDKVYVASGYWFAWDDRSSGGTSQVSLKTAELQHSPIPGTDPSFVSPPLAEMTGMVTEALSWSHVGMGYAFQQSKEPIDLSTYSVVLFYARGDGKQYQVKLESAAVKDNDYHRALFLAEPEWKLVRVPFSSLSQEGWGQSIQWTGKDIETISFVTVGRPHESIHLVVDRISLVINTHPADKDSDNVIDDFELLDYIDLWADGQVEDFDLLDAIDLWAAGHY